MFREATEWSVLLQKTHVFMLPHTELVVFFANLNPFFSSSRSPLQLKQEQLCGS